MLAGPLSFERADGPAMMTFQQENRGRVKAMSYPGRAQDPRRQAGFGTGSGASGAGRCR
jgi:hypothetical protein